MDAKVDESSHADSASSELSESDSNAPQRSDDGTDSSMVRNRITGNSGSEAPDSGEPDSGEPGSGEPGSGNETPDTDKEEEDHRRRKAESKRKGTQLIHRASFKRDKVDRYYDKFPWLLGAVSRLLHLKMAPINIPWHRRKETMAVLLWMSIFLFLGLGATVIMIYMFLYTQYWWMSLCYLCFYIPDRTICNRGGRRANWMRQWSFWKHFRNFFPVRLIKTAELDPDHNYIMGYHPHGILCAGAFVIFSSDGTGFSEMFPGITPTLLTLEVLFYIPFYRELFLVTGAVSATRASMDHMLGSEETGRALCLVVGGAPESLDSHPNKVILHLDQRKGFIKMALRHGTSLVPMFGFGENDVYDQLDNPKGSSLRKIQDFLQRIFEIPPCIFMGRGVFQYSLGIVPFRKPIYIVVGSPIHVELVKKPTSEQILELHSRYKQALIDLYNTHKHTYAKDPSVPIQFL